MRLASLGAFAGSHLASVHPPLAEQETKQAQARTLSARVHSAESAKAVRLGEAVFVQYLSVSFSLFFRLPFFFSDIVNSVRSVRGVSIEF